MGHLWSGRAPGRPGEPFRAIQGAHDTGANPNETRLSFLEVGLLFYFFCESIFFALWAGLGVAQTHIKTQKMEKVRTSETSLHSCHGHPPRCRGRLGLL